MWSCNRKTWTQAYFRQECPRSYAAKQKRTGVQISSQNKLRQSATLKIQSTEISKMIGISTRAEKLKQMNFAPDIDKTFAFVAQNFKMLILLVKWKI